VGFFSRLSDIIKGKSNKALDRLEDPAEMLDLSYTKMQDNLTNVRRALADIATARKRLEIQAEQLHAQGDKLQTQAKAALAQGNEDLAREALSRRELIVSQLADLGAQHEQTAAQQAQLEATATKLQREIVAFRTRKDTMKATYAASKASVKIQESMSSISEGSANAGATLERAQEKINQMRARSGAIDELMLSGALGVGDGKDDIDRQLDALSSSYSVDTELDALRAELSESSNAAAVGAGSSGELERGEGPGSVAGTEGGRVEPEPEVAPSQQPK